jgi:hypothetical protein
MKTCAHGKGVSHSAQTNARTPAENPVADRSIPMQKRERRRWLAIGRLSFGRLLVTQIDCPKTAPSPFVVIT